MTVRHPRPPMIRTDHTNAFANRTMKVRVPAIIREVLALNPDYPTAIQAAVNRLREDLENGAEIQMINLPAPDYDDWLPQYEQHKGDGWQSTEWFYAEVYFYRQLMQAVRWFETGRDPFAPKKHEELTGDTLWTTLESTREIEHETLADRLLAMFLSDLWGNRIDLSYALSASHGGAWVSDDLLVDDREAIVKHLLTNRGTVHLVADNTGTELAMDLALIDVLLEGKVTETVILHLKYHPTFVSDATVSDVLTLLDILESGQRGENNVALGRRLRAAIIESKLRLAPDGYWNSSRLLSDLPVRLQKTFDNALLVIVKGDANYRRVVDDAIWPADTSFVDVVDYFPAPLVALRTLKSDPVVGLKPGQAGHLDTIDPDWRINGRRGVIQWNRRG